MIRVLDKSFKPFISSNDIQHRIKDLADEINRDYQGKKPIIIGVLNGAFMFLTDLVKLLHIECEITFVRLSSYKDTSTSGKVIELMGLKESINGRDILIVEDIIDTGTTFSYFLPQLKQSNPLSLKIATLLYKPTCIVHKVQIDYIGFEIEDNFVIGYGLDYNGLGRNLTDIYQLEK